MVEPAQAAAPEVNGGDAAVATCVNALRARFGDGLAGVLLYGSYLRGKRDTVLDFYVLLDDYRALPGGWPARLANRLLPPNVYHLRCALHGHDLAAKYACLSLAAFEAAIAHDLHPYFWARFTQPCVLVHARDAELAERIAACAWTAGYRLIGATLPMLPGEFTSAQAWHTAFALTYGCELRSEGPARAAELAEHYAGHLARLLEAVAPTLALTRLDGGRWRGPRATATQHWCGRIAWMLRRVLGKSLSMARLFKAAFTFDDPLAYVLWKVERHSGVRVEASVRQRRHPLLYGWRVLWRLYRRGGFR